MKKIIFTLVAVVAIIGSGFAQEVHNAKGYLLTSGMIDYVSLGDEPRFGAELRGYYFINRYIGLGAHMEYDYRKDIFETGERVDHWIVPSPGIRSQIGVGQKTAIFLESNLSWNYYESNFTNTVLNPGSTSTSSRNHFSVQSQPGLIYFPVKWIGLEASFQGFRYSAEENNEGWEVNLGTDQFQLGARLFFGLGKSE